MREIVSNIFEKSLKYTFVAKTQCSFALFIPVWFPAPSPGCSPSHLVEHVSSSDCPPCLLVMASALCWPMKKTYMSHRDNGFGSGSQAMC